MRATSDPAVQQPLAHPSGASGAQSLLAERAYGDWCVASGSSVQQTPNWLPDLTFPGTSVRRYQGRDLAATLRGTADFFARHVAENAEATTVVVVIGTPFDRSNHRVWRPADFLGQPLDERVGNTLWGQFTILRFDVRSGEVEWLVDLQRSMSPWVTATDRGLAALRFAPLPSLTGARLDPEAAGEFLVHGIVGREHTPVAGWKLLPAGASVRWSSGREIVTGSATHPIHLQPVGGADPYTDLAEEMTATLSAVQRSFAGALLPLTGGIDSRMLLAGLLKAGIDTECYTHGTPGCADRLTVEEYQRHVPLRHRYHAIDAPEVSQFVDRAATVLTRLGPDYDALGYPHVLTSYAAEPPRDRLFLAGVGTGIHKVPYLPQLGMEGSRVPLLDAAVRHYAQEANLELLQPQIAAVARERVRSNIGAVLAECPPGTRRVHAVQYYHLQERLGRWAGKGMQLQDLCGYDICYPFLAPRLMQESRRLGYLRLHLGQKIIRAIEILEPRLLAVDNANGWPVTRFTPLAVARRLPTYWRGFSRYVYRKRRGTVAANIAVVDYRPVYREAYRDWTHELLEPGRSHLETVVRPEALQQLLANLDAGTPSAKRLGPLAALELWCRS